jgi:hypothetical protein
MLCTRTPSTSTATPPTQGCSRQLLAIPLVWSQHASVTAHAQVHFNLTSLPPPQTVDSGTKFPGTPARFLHSQRKFHPHAYPQCTCGPHPLQGFFAASCDQEDGGTSVEFPNPALLSSTLRSSRQNQLTHSTPSH